MPTVVLEAERLAARVPGYALQLPAPQPSAVAWSVAELLGGRRCVTDVPPPMPRLEPLADVYGALDCASARRLRGPYPVVRRGGELEAMLPLRSLAGYLLTPISRARRVLRILAGETVPPEERGRRLLEAPCLLYQPDPSRAKLRRLDGAEEQRYLVAVDVETSKSPPREPVELSGGVRAWGAYAGQLLEEALEDIWGSRWRRPVKEMVIVTVTPVVVETPVEGPPELPLAHLDALKRALDFALQVAELPEAKSAEPLPGTRAVLALLSLGVTRDGSLRPFTLALMPGAVVKLRGLARGVSPWEVFREGIGMYRELGYGTVAPLPEPR